MDATKQQARRWALLAAVAISLYGCWLLFRPFLGVLTWAVVLAIIFHSMHRRIRAWTDRPNLSAILSTALVVLVVLLPVTLAVLAVVNDLPNLVRNARELVTQLLGPETENGEPGLVVQWLGRYVDVEQLRNALTVENLSEDFKVTTAAGHALGLAGGLAGGIAQALFVVFSLFYLFRDGDSFMEWLPHVLPLEPEQSRELFHRTREMIDASVYGVIVLALIQGTLGGLAFWALGLPNPFIWGAVMVLLSIIPITGSFLVWAPAALYLAATGNWGKAALLTAWGLLVIGTIDNFMRPWVMGQRVRMHELLLFFAVLGGLAVFGVAGVVLGPVLVALALSLLDILRQSGKPAAAIRREPGLAEQTAMISDDGGASEAEAREPASAR